MTWLSILTVVAAVIAVFALLGLHPKGGRQVANTQLMNVGRVVLVIFIAVMIYFALRS
jgi:hypothetical protein